ncbi:hypothetical protein [Alkalimarinus sediminis]|uniref:Uncharacterized protein n=1 Tax=Alkalimarinus sediminis TaxID=1632866 RepID=A0A9E8HRA3_9ALTE|nr:hypothetical protein [Alkalimarinus sediminis]UZW75041.1 hypothetical protein NNL22_00100 [Alkalimarinus sediminis]
MAIYDHKYGDLPYFRVFRAWGGTEYQEYVRIKRSRKAAYNKAKAIDEKLAQRQKAYYTAQAYTKEFHMRPDGRIRGVRRIIVRRKGRNPTEVFELRINIPWEDDIRRTTLSIDVHGFDKAFNMAVEKVAEWYGLASDSEAKKAMKASYDVYRLQTDPQANTDKPVKANKQQAEKESSAVQKAKDEIGSFAERLLGDIKKFTGSKK